MLRTGEGVKRIRSPPAPGVACFGDFQGLPIFGKAVIFMPVLPLRVGVYGEAGVRDGVSMDRFILARSASSSNFLM